MIGKSGRVSLEGYQEAIILGNFVAAAPYTLFTRQENTLFSPIHALHRHLKEATWRI
ncbi:hypothetical protein [Janthinobacterium sp. RB2R34]|uniref:hypothetical protein n=1 Tax=Janthinobacterium sp. RB2R34 TaxID=3424193 RepID=UPI003F25FFFD